MAEPIGALRGELSLSAAQFEQDIKAARSALRREAAGMETAMGSFQAKTDATIRTLGNLSLAAAAGVGVLAVMAGNAIAAADGIAKMADSAGVGVEFLQELRFAAGRSGIGVEELDKAMLKLSRTIGDAVRGTTAEASRPFEELGVALTDASGATRSTEAVFNDLAAAFERIEDPARRASLAQELFGRSGARMTVLLREGADGINELRAAAQRLGVVLDADMVRRAEVANDALDDMKMVMQVQAQVMALQLMPVMQRFAEMMTSPQLLGSIQAVGETFAWLVEQALTYHREIMAVVAGLQVARLMPGPLGLAAGAIAGVTAYQALRPEIEAIRRSLLTREEMENLAQEERMIALREGLEAGIITEQEFAELRLETELDTMDRMAELRQQQLDAERAHVEERIRLEEHWADQVKASQMSVANNFVGFLRVMGQKSKVAALAAVALNAGLMAAQAWQNTLAAEMRALAELGPIAGPPVAAQIHAWGLANVGLILATGLAQGFAGGGAAGGAGGGGGAAAAASTIDGGTATAAPRGGIAYITLPERRSRFTDEEVMELLDGINELVRDGFVIEEIRTR